MFSLICGMGRVWSMKVKGVLLGYGKGKWGIRKSNRGGKYD
jgi:hypothetical protein